MANHNKAAVFGWSVSQLTLYACQP